ncbi:hypothetical protein [Bradyrhizobium sp. USDA 10063]
MQGVEIIAFAGLDLHKALVAETMDAKAKPCFTMIFARARGSQG